MQVDIITKIPIRNVKITNLDKESSTQALPLEVDCEWYRLTIPCDRTNIKDIIIGGESIEHRLNSGKNINEGFEIWINGDLAKYFSRLSTCIAQDDLLKFKNLDKKYLQTVSWNEHITGDFIPNHVISFFGSGEGPFWYHRQDFHKLPYVKYEGPNVSTDIDLDKDLTFRDTKFYGAGNCKSIKPMPTRPTMPVESIKDAKLREAMKQFGFSEVLQMQYVELQPNSVIPVHKDDFYYEDGRDIIDGPTQLYFVLSGNKSEVKFKFENVGLIDVDGPIFINNHRFIHSLVYTGKEPRGVLLAYGISSITNKSFITT